MGAELDCLADVLTGRYQAPCRQSAPSPGRTPCSSRTRTARQSTWSAMRHRKAYGRLEGSICRLFPCKEGASGRVSSSPCTRLRGVVFREGGEDWARSGDFLLAEMT